MPEPGLNLISDFAVENYELYLMDRPSSLKSLFGRTNENETNPRLHEKVDEEVRPPIYI